MKLILRLLILAPAFSLVSFEASAGPKGDWKTCKSAQRPGQVVAACTKVIDRASSTKRRLADARIFRGAAYIKRGQYEKALADFDRAENFYRNYSYFYILRGNALMGSREYDRALANYDKAVEIDPKGWRQYASRANLRQQMSKCSRAMEDYSQAIKINPKIASLYFRRGLCYISTEQAEKAVKDFTMAISQGYTSSNVFYYRGMALRSIKRYDEAVADLEKAAQGGVWRAMFELGMSYSRAIGVDQDVVRAYMWYFLAAKSGDAQAKYAAETAMAALQLDISLDQINEAEKRARAWETKYKKR